MRVKHKGRFTGSTAIVLAGLALMAGGLEAGAQTRTELVSNRMTFRMTGTVAVLPVCAACVNETRRFANDGSSLAYAQALMTGPGGATLHSIDVRLQLPSGVSLRLGPNDPPTPTLELRRGTPKGPLVATLTRPRGVVPGPTRGYKFYAPAGTALDAMTKYFVVVKNAEILIATTASPRQRAAATGWTLERGYWRSAGGSDYEVRFHSRTSSLSMRVWGSQTAAQREPAKVWTCDTDGNGIDRTDRALIAITGGDSRFADAAQTIQEGENIVIEIGKTFPATDDCWGEPDAPWVATLRLTRRSTDVLTPRVSASQLGEHRIEIHRNQQTVTVTIEVEDNDIPQGETVIEAELVRHADTHEQLDIVNERKRFTIDDEDPFEVFYDLPCDEDIRVTEGVDSHVTVPLRVTAAPEFKWGILLVSVARSAVAGADYVEADKSIRVVWEAGQETAEARIRLIDDKVLENEEGLDLRIFGNALPSGGTVATCPGAAQTGRKAVRIADDDGAVMQLGPQHRTVAAGETIRFVANHDLEGRCPVPFGQDVRPTISAGATELKTVPTEATRYPHCARDVVLFEIETNERQCGDHGPREIRFRFDAEAVSAVNDDLAEHITIEHDEYVVRVDSTEADYAKSFTTGSATDGYVLDMVGVGVSSGTCVPVEPRVEIWAASTEDQRPTTVVWPLFTESANSATFKAAPGTKLDPDTRYHVVMLAKRATEFSDTGNGQTALTDGANLDGVTVDSMTRFKRTLQGASAWQPDDDNSLRIALTLNAATAPPAPAAEPAADTVDWKTSLTVGNWTSVRGEYERGWRLHACAQTRVDVSDIEEHSPNDHCYGSIEEKQFTVGSTTYTLAGVFHGVSVFDDTVTMEFDGESDLTALAGRAFIINGKTFWMAGARIDGSIDAARAITWPEPAWTSAGGWTVGSTVWIGLKASGTTTSNSRASPRTTVTRDGSGPVHGPFGIDVAFSEDVNGFDASDIDVVNGELVEGSLSPHGERTWTARVAPRRSGPVTVSVPGGATEADGLDNAPSAPLVVEADIAPAQATVSRIGDGPLDGPFSVRVTFSKPVTGLTMDELDIDGGWATGMASERDGQSHEVLITPDAGAQTITITVPADVAQDASGRGNAASTTLRIGAPAPPSRRAS